MLPQLESGQAAMAPKGKVVVLGSIASSLLNFRSPLIRQLLARGYEVVAAAPAIDEAAAMRISALGARPLSIQLARTGMNPAADLLGAFRLWLVLRREKPTGIISYTAKPVIYGMLAGSAAGVKIRSALITGLGYSFTEGPGLKRKVARIVASTLYRFALPRATACVFQNPDDQKLFLERRLLPRNTPTGIVNGSGIDTSQFSVVPLPDSPAFLMIARFNNDKGIREYVAAGRALKATRPDVRVMLVGWRDTTPDSISAEEEASWSAAGIENLGRLSDVRPAIASATVVVLPSYREGTPRSVLEGMAMGRAIITTDVPGCRETVEHGRNGLLVPARNSDALLDAMTLLASDPVAVVRMGRAARSMAEEKYEADAVARATLNLSGFA